MSVQPIVSFRDVRASAGLMSDIERRVAALGNPFHVRIDLTMPGGQVVVKEQPATRATTRAVGMRVKDELAARLKHVRTAVTQSFAVARRQLQDLASRKRGG